MLKKARKKPSRRSLRQPDEQEQEVMREQLVLVGVCLWQAQQAEDLLGIILVAVMPRKGGFATAQELLEARKKLQEQTLGRLIRALKARARIQRSFRSKIGRFLKMRNKFAHEMFRKYRFINPTKLQRKRLDKFLDSMYSSADEVVRVLGGIIVHQADKLGIRLRDRRKAEGEIGANPATWGANILKPKK